MAQGLARRPRSRDYGVVLTGSLDDDTLGYDAGRDRRRARAGRPEPSEAFFDRGPGLRRLAGGATHAAVDLL